MAQMLAIPTWEQIVPELVAEETLNDSDKVISVTTNMVWQIMGIWIELATSAVAGNRVIRIEIRDTEDDVIYQEQAVNAQLASTTEYYNGRPTESLEGSKENIAARHFISLPKPLELPSSFDIRIYDKDAIDAAADDMVIQMMVKKKRTGKD